MLNMPVKAQEDVIEFLLTPIGDIHKYFTPVHSTNISKLMIKSFKNVGVQNVAQALAIREFELLEISGFRNVSYHALKSICAPYDLLPGELVGRVKNQHYNDRGVYEENRPTLSDSYNLQRDVIVAVEDLNRWPKRDEVGVAQEPLFQVGGVGTSGNQLNITLRVDAQALGLSQEFIERILEDPMIGDRMIRAALTAHSDSSQQQQSPLKSLLNPLEPL